MIGFRDMTFCSHYETCKSGSTCLRAYNDKVHEEAVKWWGDVNYPIAVFLNPPTCHKPRCTKKNQ